MAEIRVRFLMRKCFSISTILGLVLGFAGCTSFDPSAAEKEIRSLIDADSTNIVLSDVLLDISIPSSDSVNLDSQWVITGVKVSTDFKSETLSISFNEEPKGNTFVTIGDSALVLIKRIYQGSLVSTLTPKAGGQAVEVTRNFGTRRQQYSEYANINGWSTVAYSFADERSDTNTTQIFSLDIKAGGLDTTLDSPGSLALQTELPSISKGTALTLSLRTAGDTSELVCLARGKEVIRFLPQKNEAKRWQAEVALDASPLVVCIIKKQALGEASYPADIDLWLIPVRID